MKKIILFLMLVVFNLSGNTFCSKMFNSNKSEIITLEKNRSTTITFRIIKNNNIFYLEFVAFRLNKYVDQDVVLRLQFDDESVDAYVNELFNNEGRTRFQVPIELGSNLTDKLLTSIQLKYRKDNFIKEIDTNKSILIKEVVKCALKSE